MASLDSALDFAKRWPIFPCNRDKTPLAKWRHEATQDPDKITEWWTLYPSALIGQPTGQATTLVVDIDVKDGISAKERARSLFDGQPIPSTLTYKTPSGGWHIHFLAPEPLGTTVGKLAPSVDTRGEGGYVVRWDAEGCEVLCHEDPAPLPSWLLDRLRTQRKLLATGSTDPVVIPEGGRNSTLASLAGTMRHRGMSREAIEAALLAENEARCIPPLPETEVRRIAASVGRYPPADSPEDHRSGDANGLLVPIGDLLTNVGPIPWIVRSILPRDALGVFYGQPETWKSLIAIDLGLSVAAGLPVWCGHPVKPGIVVYVCGEGQHGIKLRAEAWFRRNEADRSCVKFFVTTAPVGVLDVVAITTLHNAIKAKCGGDRPALVIFDTLQRNFGPGDENSTGDMTRFVAHLDQYIREPFGCSCLVVHHSGQADKSRARGSIVLRSSADVEFSFTKDGNNVTMACTKMKDGKSPPPLGFALESFELYGIVDEEGDIETAPVLLTTTPPKRAKARGKAQSQILEAIIEMKSSPGDRMDYSSLRQHCLVKDMAESSFDKAFKGLLTKGLIKRDGSKVWLC